ncbi:MAG: ATP-binding protein [bacterium]
MDHPDCARFLAMVDDAYRSFEKDVSHIENILEESLKELFIANQELINERDSTKTKLETIVENVEGVIFESDLEGNFTFLNQAWETYSGFSVQDSIGKNFRHFLKDEFVESDKSVVEIFSGDIEGLEFVFKYPKPNKTMWFEVKFKLNKDSKGNRIGFVGTIIDITNLKKTEIDLQEASKAKDQFLSTMSHEIRTPLNAVTGLSNILLMDDHMPEQEENLKALKYSGEHLLGLINDLLDFSKIKSGKLKLVEKEFNLEALLNNIHSNFAHKADKKEIEFEVKRCNKTPFLVIGDGIKLSQVLKNLLSNSFKFTEQGGIKLTVSNLGVKNNRVDLEFKVIDTGIGIAKEKQETIFESFMQESAETSVKYGGTGLGLAICKRILKLQDSDLEVVSEPGKGSTFSFTLSFKISNRLSTYTPDLIQTQPTYKPLHLNILVAEDNKMNVLILKKFFQMWKVDYTLAYNGEEAIEIYNERDFDLILMDLQMPVMNGYEATKVIRGFSDKEKANIPIVALTAFAQADIKAKTQKYRMNGFMSKPFNPPELYNLLASYCQVAKNKIAVEK